MQLLSENCLSQTLTLLPGSRHPVRLNEPQPDSGAEGYIDYPMIEMAA
jgi:hypothetical protein